MTAQVKQVIVVRADLGMSRGKMAAQACHAAVGALIRLPSAAMGEAWAQTGETTIVLRVESLEELQEIEARCFEARIPSHTVIDEGRTEFAGVKTPTCIGIGPHIAALIDEITGHLKTFR